MSDVAWSKYGKFGFLQNRISWKLIIAFLIIIAAIAVISIWLAEKSHSAESAKTFTTQAKPLKPVATQEMPSVSTDITNSSKQDIHTSQTSSSAPVDVAVDGDKQSVKINGESVTVPSSGTVHKTIHNNNGDTSVDVSMSSNSDQTATSSYVDLSIDSSSTTRGSQ